MLISSDYILCTMMNLDASISTVMTGSVTTVTPDQRIVDIKHLYERPEFHSHIPVAENGRLVGIVSIVNFMRAIHDATLDDSEPVYQTTLVREIMTPHPVSVHPETTIREVIRLLADGDFHSVVVTSDESVQGIVTTTDLLRLLLND